MSKNKISFTVKIGEKDVELAVVKPSIKVQQEAQLVYAAAFNKFVQAGGILRQKLDAYIREQKLWDDTKQKNFEDILTKMSENEKVVQGKVKGVTLTKAKAAAIDLRRNRIALRTLLSDRTELEQNTVEQQAHQEKFNFLVSACTVYSTDGKPFFANYEDYLNRADDDVSVTAASNFAMLFYKYDPEEDKKLPENAFLIKYKLCNDELHLVDGEGRLVDTEGRLVNAEGRFIDESGKFVDIDGKPVDDEGNPITETFPFVDDEGNPIK